MSTKLKIAAAVAAAVLLSACSSPKHEPMPLVNFTPSMEVTEVWSKGLSSAEGFLVPAVYDDMVFAAGGKTLTRLNARTGETEWSVSFDSPFSGGVGADGHIASNDPGSSLTSRTRIKTLTSETVKANSRFFDGDISQVPRTALTVGIGTIMGAEEVMILAAGANKARAIHHAIEGSISHMWPVSILQMHQHALIVCDEDAANEMKADTVRYFKDIESRIVP